MGRLYKLLPFFLFLKACGSQDYGEPRVQPVVVDNQEWREDALAMQGHPASVFFGAEDGCEPDSICVESSYFGRYQMQELADRYPDYFAYSETEEEAKGQFISAQRYLIETDLLVLEKNERLNLCGNENIIVASEASGGGEISGSAAACSRQDGAPIKLIAPDLYDLRLTSDGLAGQNAAPVVPPDSDLKAADGDPASLRVEIVESRKPTKLCISRGSCDEDKELRERNFDTLETLGLYTRIQFRKWVHKDILKGTSAWPETNNFEVYPDLHCWFEATGDEKSSSLLEAVSASLVGRDRLNGRDADKIWSGNNGGDGGNAGAIEVTTIKQKEMSYVADAKGGSPGLGSLAVAQEPGEGVSPAKTVWSFNIESSYRIFCRGSIEKSWSNTKDGTTETGRVKFTTPGSVDAIVQTRKILFRLGGLNRFDLKSDFIGELLAPADLFGSNGLPISDSELAKENGRAGKRGLDSIPTRTEAENPEILTQRLRELCSTCEAPIVLEFKNYENTGGSDEES